MSECSGPRGHTGGGDCVHAGAPDQCTALESWDKAAQDSSHGAEHQTLPHGRDPWEETDKCNGMASSKRILCVAVSMLDHSWSF